MMTLDLSPLPVPLCVDSDGVVRVRNSRIPIDTVVHFFQNGESPEGIILSFPTLKLVDVYAIIAYYLQHQAEVDAYLEQRDQEAKAIRAEIEARSPQAGLREKLLARLAAQKQSS